LIESEGFNAFADRWRGEDSTIDDKILILNANRIFFLQIFLRDIRGGSPQSALPFFTQRENAQTQFAHWTGGGEGQQMVACVRIKKDNVHNSGVDSKSRKIRANLRHSTHWKAIKK